MTCHLVAFIFVGTSIALLFYSSENSGELLNGLIVRSEMRHKWNPDGISNSVYHWQQLKQSVLTRENGKWIVAQQNDPRYKNVKTIHSLYYRPFSVPLERPASMVDLVRWQGVGFHKTNDQIIDHRTTSRLQSTNRHPKGAEGTYSQNLTTVHISVTRLQTDSFSMTGDLWMHTDSPQVSLRRTNRRNSSRSYYHRDAT